MDFLNEIEFNWKLIILIAGIIVGAFAVSKIFRWIIDKSFEAVPDKLNVEATRYTFFKNAISFVVWIIASAAIVYLIPSLRALAITMFAGAGILFAAIGFAAQQAFANIVNGIFIVISKPFRVGDLIKVGNQNYGVVEDITLRHTVINSFENKQIIIPNSIVNSEVIINDSYTDVNVCRWVDVGISYDSDLDLAIKIMREESEKHPSCIDVRTKKQKKEGVPKVRVRTVGFGDSSVNLRALVWTSDPWNAIQMHSDLNKSIKERFDKEGVEIPFPYRTVVYKKDLPKNAKLKSAETKEKP